MLLSALVATRNARLGGRRLPARLSDRTQRIGRILGQRRFPDSGSVTLMESFAAVSCPAIDCRCAGDAREMGVTQGLNVRSKAPAVYRVLRELEGFRLQQPPFLPYLVFLRLAERRATTALATALREMDTPMLARLHGLAEGASMPLRTVCLYNAMEAFLCSTAGVTIAPPGCCSAVAVRGRRSRRGETILARNFDYIPAVQPFFLLRESRPRDGLRALEFTTALHAGAFDGVNEKGLAVIQNYAFVTDRSRPGPLISMVISGALAACATVAEATDFIARRHRWGAAILTLGDSAGDIAVVELSNTRAAVRRPGPGEDWLVATNVCICPEITPVQTPASFVYSDRAPRALRRTSVLEWHALRMRRLCQLIEPRCQLDEAELANMMADHGPDGHSGGTSPCVHTEYWRTTASIQWFPARRAARVSYGPACAAAYVELAL
jgi:hypothetical protein